VLESLGGWVERRYGLPKLWFQVVVVSSLGVALLMSLYLTSMADWFRGRLFGEEQCKRLANVEELRKGFKGLVVAVSKPRPGSTQPTPAELAIWFHLKQGTLAHCWMICTEESEGEAAAIVERMEARGARSEIFHYGEQHVLWGQNRSEVPMSLMLTAAAMDDPNVMRQLVDRIYGEAVVFGVMEGEVVVDYTGGTKSMTAGMMLACVSPKRQVEYLSQVMGRLMLVRTAYELRGKYEV
jgi:CRISPR-associated protein (Cas_Cas02710)